MAQFILTAIGEDRPGLVGHLTGLLHDAGANILDSRMVNLRGQFAALLLFDASKGPLPADLLDRAAAIGLSVTLLPQKPPTKLTAGIGYRLKTYSLDQPGLVHRVSEVLRSHGVNIEDLSARQESAAFAGDPLFIMEMRLTLPAGVSVKALRTDLDAACDKLNADLDLEPATT